MGTKWVLKGCKRCVNGDLYLDHVDGEWQFICIQCSQRYGVVWKEKKEGEKDEDSK